MSDQYRIKFAGGPLGGICKMQRVLAGAAQSSGDVKLEKGDVAKLFHALAHCIDTETFLPSLAGSPALYVPVAIEDGTGKISVQVSSKRTATLDVTAASFLFRPTQDPEGKPITNVPSNLH